MNKRLFWKLCLIIGSGVVAMFYFINVAITQIEGDMSLLKPDDIAEMRTWAKQAESLHKEDDLTGLTQWLEELKTREETWAVIAQAQVKQIVGEPRPQEGSIGLYMGRDIEWPIHLYFKENPIMEIRFTDGITSLLIQLPSRMRPGSYWNITRMTLQVLLPLLLMALLSFVLYHHIMMPIRELDAATRAFASGNFEVRVKEQLGSRNDELAQLSETFDRMADHIGDLILRQRQLITDLSHELRTPLTRLDIATENLMATDKSDPARLDEKLSRITRESRHIRRLVDDTLTLSWLENERPNLRNESLDLVDLLQVIIDDAQFEYPDRNIVTRFPNQAPVSNSNHRAVGQAIENIIRNALRYTPIGKDVVVEIESTYSSYKVNIIDCGPGIPTQYLSAIFQPFFRVEKSRSANGSSFGLGLALAKRQLKAVSATVFASNIQAGGLKMSVTVPQQ